MKILNILFLIVFSLKCFGQERIELLDTINSNSFKHELSEFYKLKYTTFNESLDVNSVNKSKLSKNIYLEYQKEFLEKIGNNNFISDKNLNDYAQKLLFEILDINKLAKKDYRVLVSNDSEKNAYNTGDGTIVVNYGLFTVLDNEDELVFVLCHEIGHQVLQHVKKEVDNFVSLNTSEEIINKTKEIKNLKYNRSKAANTFLLKLNYKNYFHRRKKEIEADSLGFHFYSKTKRDLNNSISLLNKLDDSNKEMDSLTVRDYKTLFETETYKIKNKYFEVEESIFKKYDYKPAYQIDSLKTHPDCLYRIKNLQKFINNQNIKAIDSSKFIELKKKANYQNLYNLYVRGEFGICLYESLKEYKKTSSKFYKDLIFLNLIEIQKAKRNQTISKYIPQMDLVYNSPSLNRFINIINNLKNTDLEIIIQKFK
ncbi:MULTISPECIES: M48 family metalloprotease [Flavobacterium]|uniref:M48 family metallopeptidase n=1 Tax=Flavobacterium hankyongi TaxID=1176532 RepID=A0ABP8ZMX9_9FLAO|nr:M48 family metalloprotease [Flavobacterium sp. N1846]